MILLITILAMVITSVTAQNATAIDRMTDCQTKRNGVHCFGLKFGLQEFFTAGESGSCFETTDCGLFLVIENTTTHIQYTFFVNGFARRPTWEEYMQFEVFFSPKVYDLEDVLKDGPPEGELYLEINVIPDDPPKLECTIRHQGYKGVCGSLTGITTAFQSLMSAKLTPTEKYSTMTYTSQDTITIKKWSNVEINYSMDMTKDRVYLYLRGRLGYYGTNDYTERVRSKKAIILFPSSPEVDATTTPASTATLSPGGTPGLTPKNSSNKDDLKHEGGDKGLLITLTVVVILTLLLIIGGGAAYWFFVIRKNKRRSPFGARRKGTSRH